MDTKLHFSSATNEWETPKALFDTLNKEFNFTLDAAASAQNKKLDNYLSDSLNVPWPGRVFLNPPYGKGLASFISKAYRESQTNAEVVVCLIPARTDTSYWHDFVMNAAEIRLIRGRIKFLINGACTNPAPFPSAIIVFKKGNHDLYVSSYTVAESRYNIDMADFD